MKYAAFYPEEGRYSKLLTLPMARALAKQFPSAIIVNMETGEVIERR